MGFLLRWLFALVLLATTYNPTPYNYVRWVADFGRQNISIAALAGLILTIGYIIYIRATLRSIGGFGMTLVIALVGAGLWVLHDLGLLKLDNGDLNTWLGLFALSLLLGIGLSWSFIRRKLSGQSDMDDISE